MKKIIHSIIKKICIKIIALSILLSNFTQIAYATEVENEINCTEEENEIDCTEEEVCNNNNMNDSCETLTSSDDELSVSEEDTADEENNYKQYEDNVVYYKGDIVFNDGTYWICNWYNVNNEPKRGKHDLCWDEYVPDLDNGISEWSPDKIYDRGQIVMYNGVIWQCQWWSDYSVPGTTGEYGCWSLYTENTNSIENEQYIDLIGLYYTYLNSDKQEKISNLFEDNLKIEYEDFFSNNLTREYNTGLWNINQAEIEMIKEIDTDTDVCSNINQYTDIKSFLVKANLDVKANDEYSWDGINYYIFTLGKENDNLKIISKRMPITDVENISDNDQDINDILYYYDNVFEEDTNYSLLDSKLQTIDNTKTVDPDYYIPAGKNWSSIFKTTINVYIQVDNKHKGGVTQADVDKAKKNRKDGQPILPVSFKNYCKTVVNSEYGTAGKKQTCYNTVAMCVKNFAINRYKVKADLGYDISNYDVNDMSYLPHKKMLASCSKAVDDTWDRVMLTAGYGLFRAYFKTNKSYSSYCVKNGGQLSLDEMEVLANKGHLRNYILHYFYDNGAYNKYTKRGEIRIVDTNCKHTYSKTSPYRCLTCGCSKKK